MVQDHETHNDDARGQFSDEPNETIPTAEPVTPRPAGSDVERPAEPAFGAEFRIGRVLSRSLSIFFRNIVPFGLLSLIVMSPPYIYAIAVDPWMYLGGSSSGTTVLVFLVEGFLGYFVTATLVYGVLQDLRGRRANLVDCMRQGLRRIFPVLGVALLSGVLTALSLLLFIVPGVIFYAMVWVAIPVAVVEKPGVAASLNRSGNLTKGRILRILGLIIVTDILLLSVTYGIETVFEVISLSVDPAGGFMDSLTVSLLLLLFLTALTWAFWAVVAAVSYNDLRTDKEGTSADQIAAVFD